MTTLHDTEIDGVRCLWVDTGRPTLAAALMFRQGMCDEPLTESGWLHLLEHSALHGRGGGALQINGSVSLLRTSFDVHGPAEAVVRHLGELTEWLTEPRLDDLDRERGVLRAESNSAGGPVPRAMAWRYGARGPGVCNYSEPALGRATAELLTERARRGFTADNAVRVLDGPPPTGLRLSLPRGEFLPPAVAVPCGDTLPAAYVDEAGVVVSGVVRRSSAVTMLPEIIQRALRDQLRNTDGAAYAPWSIYEPVDSDHAVVIAGSDVNADRYPHVVKTTWGIIRKLRGQGAPADHVRETVESMTQAMMDPYNMFGLAFRGANAVLEGREPETVEEMLATVRAITPASLADGLDAFAATMLMGIPGQAKRSEDLPILAAPIQASRQTGRRFRHQDWPATGYELRIDDTTLQLADMGEARSAEVAEVEAMFVFADGGRHVLMRDGYGLTIEPGEWGRGAEAVALLDRLVDPDKHLSQAARDGRLHGARMSAPRRWWRGLQRATQAGIGRWVFIAFVVTFAFAAASAGAYLPLIALLFVGLYKAERWIARRGFM